MNHSEEEQEKIICRCEEVTEKEIRQAIKEGAKTLREIKMITRAGMGLCQGRTCSKIISRILKEETGQSLDKIEPAGYRPPVRPTTLGTLANNYQYNSEYENSSEEYNYEEENN